MVGVALGLSLRNGVVLQHGYSTPTSVEVVLERLGPDGAVVHRLPLVAPEATAAEPYGDNYRGWTRRSVLLPGGELVPFLGQPVRLAFRLNLANSNDANLDLPANFAAGTGTAQDTDLVSPNLGWAIAAPRVWVAVGRPACDAAG